MYRKPPIASVDQNWEDELEPPPKPGPMACLLTMVLAAVLLWIAEREYRAQLAFIPAPLQWLIGFVMVCVLGWIGVGNRCEISRPLGSQRAVA